MNQTIYAQTSPRILKEIPKFFKGFETALGELFQNAYRARAKTVFVLYEPNIKRLTISDDGPGLADPQRLITAGETGWNEEEFTEPAGMGAFSLLRPDFVNSVTYQSYQAPGAGNWQMTIDESILLGKPVQVQKIENVDGRTGLTVILNLGEKVNVIPDMIAVARSLYPYTVYYQEEAGIEEIQPINEWGQNEVVVFETSVGKLEYTHDPKLKSYERGISKYLENYYSSDDQQFAVWEHRKIKTRTMREALHQAIARSRLPALAELLLGSAGFRWEINPSSGVRPKLPDRDDLLNDSHLASALDVLVEAVVAKHWDILQKEAQNWPDEIDHPRYGSRLSIPTIETSPALDSCIRIGNNQFGHRYALVESLKVVLESLGWHKVEYTDPYDIEFYEEDESLRYNVSSTKKYLKKPQAFSGEEILVDSLNLQGVSTVMSTTPTITEVEVANLRFSKDCPWVAFADSLNVPNVGNIKFLVSSNVGPDWSFLKGADPATLDEMVAADTCIIYAGTPKEFITELHSDQRFSYLIAMIEYESSDLSYWAIYDSDGRYSLDEDLVVKDVEIGVVKAYAPNLFQKRKIAFDVEEVAAKIRLLQDQYYYEIRRLGKINDTQVAQITKELEVTENNLKTALGKLEDFTRKAKANTAM